MDRFGVFWRTTSGISFGYFLGTVDFGDLDYGNEGMVNIAVTVAYDWATLEAGGRAKRNWALNPGIEREDDTAG